MSSLSGSKKVTFNIEKNEYFYIPKKVRKSWSGQKEITKTDFSLNELPRGDLKKQCTKVNLENGEHIFIKHNGLFM